MEQSTYIKAIFGLTLAFVIVILIIASTFLIPFIMYGPFSSMIGNDPRLSPEETKPFYDEIKQKSSVKTFKEKFTDYKESENNSHNLTYTLQSRNHDTGNILSLDIYLNFRGMPGADTPYEISEHLTCIPGQGILGPENKMRGFPPWENNDLFLDQSIKDSTCLDDDYKPIVISSEP